MMKTLTKIRLINWHYFNDETINVKGSALFSGENASGKSTILDAIQLVLTTNSRRFNPAANEKSKRTLQGYIRCKTGEEGNNYVRANGPVISFVALEFFEESKNQYFVIGVKIDQRDVDGDIAKKWFNVEGELDSLTFIVNGKPALDKEFTQNEKKVQLETQVERAKDNFKIRLGRLDDTFGDMILKSMAFKPMDKVKDFINKFILPENKIETGNLQDNIRNLRELQKLIQEVKTQIAQLNDILKKADEIDEIEYKKLVIDILLKVAALESEKERLNLLEKQNGENEISLSLLQEQCMAAYDKRRTAQTHLDELRVALQTNEVGQMISRLKEQLSGIEQEIFNADNEKNEYLAEVKNLQDASAFIPIKEKIFVLKSEISDDDEKIRSLNSIKTDFDTERDKAYQRKANILTRKEEIQTQLVNLSSRIEELKKNRIVHNDNTVKLQSLINQEFNSRRIDSAAMIFSDLLEMTDNEWQNAVEGYLNSQRFNVIVEPKYFDIAAEVYNRNKDKVHSVGLVDIGKIMSKEVTIEKNSLAEKVTSENRFARAYADFLLGRVVCCDSVNEINSYSIAITKSCMKYQGHVLQKIDSAVYNCPFIGRNAIKIQLENARKEYEKLTEEKNKLENDLNANTSLIEAINKCNLDIIQRNLGCFGKIRDLKKAKQKIETDLCDAKKNPTLIDLQIKYDAAEKAFQVIESDCKAIEEKITNKKRDIDDLKKSMDGTRSEIARKEEEKKAVSEGKEKALSEAVSKYQESLKNNDAAKIQENYQPRLATLNGQREKAHTAMVEMQAKYKSGDFGTGVEVIELYRDDLAKLEKSDLVSYEDKLVTAQSNCELEFRENFLAKMREHIERAEEIFRNLNQSLKGIYYGNDSYKFELTSNREKQSLYDMIMSDVNVSGQTLFTSVFEEKYHAEMDELFSKLTDENLNDADTINELTDYRSFLDYDIQVISRDGKMQRFSKTYGEKSGGETQTPYYVAIAASFAQMYSGRETIRIVMLDEAFNNMDDDRTASMLEFFKSQNFQVILACPPAKMDIIGEYMDSVFLTIHKDNFSVVEEYYL